MATRASATRRAIRWRPPAWADITAATIKTTRRGNKSLGPSVNSLETAA